MVDVEFWTAVFIIRDIWHLFHSEVCHRANQWMIECYFRVNNADAAVVRPAVYMSRVLLWEFAQYEILQTRRLGDG